MSIFILFVSGGVLFEGTVSLRVSLGLGNLNNTVVSHLNINSIRNKFTLLKEIIICNIDISLLSDIRIDDETFPNAQFEIEGQKVFRKNSNKHGGDILIYIDKNIRLRELNSNILQKEIDFFWVFT